VAVVDDAAGGLDGHQAEAVAVGQRSIVFPLDDLQPPHLESEDQEDQDDDATKSPESSLKIKIG